MTRAEHRGNPEDPGEKKKRGHHSRGRSDSASKRKTRDEEIKTEQTDSSLHSHLFLRQSENKTTAATERRRRFGGETAHAAKQKAPPPPAPRLARTHVTKAAGIKLSPRAAAACWAAPHFVGGFGTGFGSRGVCARRFERAGSGGAAVLSGRASSAGSLRSRRSIGRLLPAAVIGSRPA